MPVAFSTLLYEPLSAASAAVMMQLHCSNALTCQML
jgi:hypothetical protein